MVAVEHAPMFRPAPRPVAPAPTPVPAAHPRLPVLDARPASAREHAPKQEQNCSVCRLASHCWRDLKTDVIVANLLVCRIKRGIDVDRSWESFLDLIFPALNKLAENLLRGDIHFGAVRERKAEFIADLQTAAVAAIGDYQLGDRSSPMAWLFQRRLGAIPRWIRAHFQRRAVRRKYSITPYDSTPGAIDQSHASLAAPDPVLADRGADLTDHDIEVAAVLGEFTDVTEDGKTLTTAEYRAFRLALDNLHRPLKEDADYVISALGTTVRGIHNQLTSVTRKVLEASGRIEDVAARHMVLVTPDMRRMRKTRASGAIVPLTTGERALVATRPDIEDRDWALILGCDKKTIWMLRRAARGPKKNRRAASRVVRR